MNKVAFLVTNMSDRRRCGECRSLVKCDELDAHAEEHGGTVGTVEQGLHV